MLERLGEVLEAAGMPAGPAFDLRPLDPPGDIWTVADSSQVLGAGEHTLEGRIRVYAGSSLVVLAPDVRLGPTARLEVRGDANHVFVGQRVRLGGVRVSVNGRGNVVYIGEGVTWESGGCMCGRRKQHVLLGDDSLMSNDVMMRTSDGHGLYDRLTGEHLNPDAPILIQPHVWIGNDMRVQKGAVVATGSVVSQRAIVSGALLEPNSLYAGIPAAPKRRGIVWSRSMLEHIPEAYR